MTAASVSAYSVPQAYYLNYTLINRDIETALDDGREPSKREEAKARLMTIYKTLESSQDPQAHLLRAKCHRVMACLVDANQVAEYVTKAREALTSAHQKMAVEYQTCLAKIVAECSELRNASPATEAPAVKRASQSFGDEIERFSRRREIQTNVYEQWIATIKTGVAVGLIFIVVQWVANYFQADRKVS